MKRIRARSPELPPRDRKGISDRPTRRRGGLVNTALVALGVLAAWLGLLPLVLPHTPHHMSSPGAPTRHAAAIDGLAVGIHKKTQWLRDVSTRPGDPLRFAACVCASERGADGTLLVQVSRLATGGAYVLRAGCGPIGGSEDPGRQVVVRLPKGFTVALDRSTFHLIDSSGRVLVAKMTPSAASLAFATAREVRVATYRVGPLASGEEAWIEFNGIVVRD
jgi:hypothetical protein